MGCRRQQCCPRLGGYHPPAQVNGFNILFFIFELGMATLTGVGVDMDPGTRAGVVARV